MPSRKRRVRHAAIVQTFAERLRSLRTSRDMTQRDLAHHAHVTLSYISKLEAGGAAPGIDLVERLAHALRVSLTELLPEPFLEKAREGRVEQVKRLFDAVLRKSGPESLSMLALFLERLLESPAASR